MEGAHQSCRVSHFSHLIILSSSPRLLSLVVVMAHESEVLTACVQRAMKRKGSKGASLGINLGPDNAQPHCRSLSVSTDWSFWC